MSEDKDSPFFADGVHEDILTNLALVRDLKVVSRTTVTQYRETKKTLRQIAAELGVAYDSLQAGRRWDEALAAQRRVVAMLPDRIEEQRTLSDLAFSATGSRSEGEALFARMTAADPDSPRNIAWRKNRAASTNFAEFKRLDALVPFFDDDGYERSTQALGAAVVYAANGDLAAARARLAGFPADLRARLGREPANPVAHINLAKAEALLGHHDEAVRLAQKAVEIMPESLDALDGPRVAVWAAEIYAWTGDKDRALAAFTHMLRAPSVYFSSVHRLRTNHWLAPLRADPRFEALLSDPKNSAPLF